MSTLDLRCQSGSQLYYSYNCTPATNNVVPNSPDPSFGERSAELETAPTPSVPHSLPNGPSTLSNLISTATDTKQLQQELRRKTKEMHARVEDPKFALSQPEQHLLRNLQEAIITPGKNDSPITDTLTGDTLKLKNAVRALFLTNESSWYRVMDALKELLHQYGIEALISYNTLILRPKCRAADGSQLWLQIPASDSYAVVAMQVNDLKARIDDRVIPEVALGYIITLILSA